MSDAYGMSLVEAYFREQFVTFRDVGGALISAYILILLYNSNQSVYLFAASLAMFFCGIYGYCKHSHRMLRLYFSAKGFFDSYDVPQEKNE